MMQNKLLGVLVAVLYGMALAQVPNIPKEFLDHSRRIQGDTVRFCVVQDMLLTELNQNVAQLLAEAMLFEAEIVPVEVPYHVAPLSYRLPLDGQQLFFLLNNDCDAVIGHLLTARALPDWLISTAPYLLTDFVLATMEEDVDSLRDMPGGSKI